MIPLEEECVTSLQDVSSCEAYKASRTWWWWGLPRQQYSTAFLGRRNNIQDSNRC